MSRSDLHGATPAARADYLHFHSITTRWIDNGAYGHVNNVVYCSWFDTVVNEFLIGHGLLDAARRPAIGLVIQTQSTSFASVAFPDRATAGLRVAALGTSRVRYEIGAFRGDEASAAAQGHFVHVCVDRTMHQPIPIPAPLRAFLQSIQTEII